MIPNVATRVAVALTEAKLKELCEESAKAHETFAALTKLKFEGVKAYERLQVLLGNCPRFVNGFWILNTGPNGELCGWTHAWTIPQSTIVKTDFLGYCGACPAWATWVR